MQPFEDIVIDDLNKVLVEESKGDPSNNDDSSVEHGWDSALNDCKVNLHSGDLVSGKIISSATESFGLYHWML